MGKVPNVAVIGAGFSGLRCADVLAQNGIQVTIFEARDRLGGRVHQSKVHDHLVDMGPNWIHGTGDNPISTIAELTKTTLVDFEGDQLVYSADGERVDDVLAARISEFMWTTIAQAFEYSNAHKDTIDPGRSLLDFVREQVEKTDFTSVEIDMCIETCRLWGTYVGDPVERQSLKFFHLEECIDGNNYFVATTYKDILQHVSTPVTQNPNITIRLNQPIIKIASQQQTASNPPHQTTLTTATGETLPFDEVVITCPLGWLKRNKASFTPPLPPRLSQAIDNISYGRLEKIYVTFPRAFWQDSCQPTTPFALFLNPSYTPHPASIPWIQECTSLAALPPSSAHPTLLFYTFGPCATHIVSQLAGLHPSSSEYSSTLNQTLHPFYSRLPGYTSDETCTPLAFTATTWQDDPYAGNGSYCNFQVGLERGDADIEVFRDGMGAERGVWFAGEHTAPFVALGTTTGAYWSGERAAAQVCGVFGIKGGIRGWRDDSLPSGSGKGGSDS